MKAYEHVFTPSAPVKRPEFFVGRKQELDDLHKAVHRPGQHPVVVGHRGVGKTSLVLQGLRRIHPTPIVITCNPEINFE